MLEELANLLEPVGQALSAPRRALWGAIGLPDSGSEALANTLGMDRNSPWTKALGFGAEVMGDPLTWAGLGLGRLASGAAKGAEAVGGAANAAESGTQALMNARRGFGVFKGVEPAAGDAMQSLAAGRLVGDSAPLGTVMKDWEAISPYFSKGAEGAYMPNSQAAFIREGASPTTARHETIHGLIDMATKNGGDGLPLAMRVPAAMQRSGNSFVQGMGKVANETAAHSLEYRSLADQLKGGARFLMNPQPEYADLFRRTSPLAAAVYQHTPTAIKGAGLAGLGAGAGAAAYPFLGD